MDFMCGVCGKTFKDRPRRMARLKRFKTPCCSLECSKKIRGDCYLDSENPNHSHDKDLDFIYDVTHDGAYLLGLIYTDGNITKNTVSIYQKEENCGSLMLDISKRIFNKVKISSCDGKSCSKITINSKNLVDFIKSLGWPSCRKRKYNMTFPNIPEDKKWSFVAGYFDGDGGFKYNYHYPEINIASKSPEMLKAIANIWGVNYPGGDKIYASGYKALDICGKMYESVTFKHSKKRTYFWDILNWEPLSNGQWFHSEFFKYKKLSPDAIPPCKARVTDSGYDVFAVDIQFDEKSKLYKANTKIAIQPIPGWYFDLIGRSSLPLSGFIFAGSVGVIDRSYVGPVSLLLHKINDDAEIPKVPFKIAQIIPRRIIHVDFVQVDELSESDRGSCGYGSTGM